MKRILLAAVMAVTAGAASAHQTFTCTNQNTDLHFVIYIDDATNAPRGGHMYVHGTQIAVLDTYRVNNISIRGTVVGNTVNTEFVFNTDRQKVYIELNGTSNEVCEALVRFPG